MSKMINARSIFRKNFYLQHSFLAVLSMLFCVLALLLPHITQAQQSAPPKPIVEWEKRQNADERLTAFGDDLMGDGIDPHTGSITFEHTDISLPGNSALDVSLKRRRTQGYLYHEDVDAEFGDWEYLVPRIKAISATARPWTGARCSSSYSALFGVITSGQGGCDNNQPRLFARCYFGCAGLWLAASITNIKPGAIPSWYDARYQR